MVGRRKAYSIIVAKISLEDVRSFSVSVKIGFDGLPSNGLGFSGGVPIDREGSRADSNFQKSYDLAGAERRPLHALVRPPDSWAN